VLHKKYAMQILLQAKNLFAYESCWFISFSCLFVEKIRP
jgi:hypothetical protein